MSCPTTEGDGIILNALSYLWAARLTVVMPDFASHTWTEVRYRHREPLNKADLVVVYNGHNHYSAARK